MSKRILIVSQYFWPEEFRINDLAQTLKNKGFEVEVLTGLPNYPEGILFKGYRSRFYQTEEWNGIKIHRIKEIPRGNSSLRLALNYVSFLFFGLIHLIFKSYNNFDRVLVYQLSPPFVGFFGIILKYKHKIKTIFYIQDLWPESISDTNSGIGIRPVLYVLDNMMRLFYSYSDSILTQSDYMKDFLINKYDLNPRKIFSVPTTVENIFESEELPITQNSSFNKKKFNIVFTGNIGKAQDFDNVLKIGELLKNQGQSKIHFHIIGEGRDKNRVEKLAKSKKLDDIFTFYGKLPLSSMPSILRQSDALLITLKSSIVFEKTIPAKLQGYMTAGKPILGMCSGITKKIIEISNSGFCVSSGDYLSFVENTQELMNLKKSEIDLFGKNAKEYFDKHFAREKIYSKLIDVIND